MELDSREVRAVAKLGLLDTRHGVLGEHALDKEVSILLDSISVHRKNTDIAR